MKQVNPTSARIRPAYRLRPEEIIEPEMSEEDWEDFERGVALFERGKYWESHEAWEAIWLRHPEPCRIFFQGLIQMAGAYHQLGRGIYGGLVKHLNNAAWKLEQFPDTFLGVDVAALMGKIREGIRDSEQLGAGNLSRFDRGLIARDFFRRSAAGE